MSERVDHAAEARTILYQASHDTDGGEVITELLEDREVADARLWVAEAQVHATLALAEQQRIANLIALDQATHPDGSRVAPMAITHPVGDYSAALNDDIREGLDR